MARIPEELTARERALLARALEEAARPPLGPRPRKTKGLRKVSQVVERTWVSAGCFGEAIQWRLLKRRKE
ncbi:MAG: hypothetical protein M9894_36885 [Planctomycetes bacterium]|nr:hypothetical protein [Planctomycetota bacterium]